MQNINIDLEQSEAVVGWNEHGLAGYAVHKGDIWSCVTTDGPLLHICRHGDSVLRWLHEAGNADFFESLSDRKDLRKLIAAGACKRIDVASPAEENEDQPTTIDLLSGISACG